MAPQSTVKVPPLPSTKMFGLLAFLFSVVIGISANSGNYYVTEWQITPTEESPPPSPSFSRSHDWDQVHRSGWNGHSRRSYENENYSNHNNGMDHYNRLSEKRQDKYIWKGASPKKVNVNYRGGRSTPQNDPLNSVAVQVQRSLTHDDADYSWREWTAPQKNLGAPTYSTDYSTAHNNKEDSDWGNWASRRVEPVKNNWREKKYQSTSTYSPPSHLPSRNSRLMRRSSMEEDVSSREVVTTYPTVATRGRHQEDDQFGWSQLDTSPQESSKENHNGWSFSSSPTPGWSQQEEVGGSKDENGQVGWSPSSVPSSSPHYNSPQSSSKYYRNWMKDAPQKESSYVNYNNEGYSSYNGQPAKSGAKLPKQKNYKKPYNYPTVTYPRYSNYGHILHEEPINDPTTTPANEYYDNYVGKIQSSSYEAERVIQKPIRTWNNKQYYTYDHTDRNPVVTIRQTTTNSPPLPSNEIVADNGGSYEQYYQNQAAAAYTHPYTTNTNDVESSWGQEVSLPPSQTTTTPPPSKWASPQKNFVREMTPLPFYEEVTKPVTPTIQAGSGWGWTAPVEETRSKPTWKNKQPPPPPQRPKKKKAMVKEYFGKVVDNFNTLCSAVFPLLGNLGRGRFCIRKDGRGGYQWVHFNGQQQGGWSYK